MTVSIGFWQLFTGKMPLGTIEIPGKSIRTELSF